MPNHKIGNEGRMTTSGCPFGAERAYRTLDHPTEYGTGNGVATVATGDFNGDGNLDLVVANSAWSCPHGTVSILLGNGDGTFRPRTDFATGEVPIALVPGDFNRDGSLDLAVVNSLDGTVSILIGNGDGTFAPQVAFATGRAPSGISARDFNADGKLDLAVANAQDNNVSILLGNGDGTFQAHVDYAAGPGAAGITADDFNGDGKAGHRGGECEYVELLETKGSFPFCSATAMELSRRTWTPTPAASSRWM